MHATVRGLLRWGALFVGFLGLPFGSTLVLAGDALAERVVILANASQADSVALARYYAAKRGIPELNIIAFPMSSEEQIGWPEFSRTIWNPLMAALLRDRWIDAVQMDAVDGVGRRRYAMHGHRISYLVVCRGVPLKIANDPLLKEVKQVLPAGQSLTAGVNGACVDSELAVLAMEHPLVNSFIPNPLFEKTTPSALDLARVVKVARLDADSQVLCLGLVDRAMEAEREGLIGRAYVDLGGPHAEGDLWFKGAAGGLGLLGYDVSIESTPALFSEAARFDAPVFYLGWYSDRCHGPMGVPDFKFPAGAVAYHLHSYSAPSLRHPGQGWCAALLEHGATATFGNVDEPYLGLCLRPNGLLFALAKGMNLGDAACFASPALSWQGVVVGDPLYRPFARSFEKQWAERATLAPEKAAYLVLRKLNLMRLEGRQVEALSYGREELARTPSLALSVGVAERLIERGHIEEAMEVLGQTRQASGRTSEERMFVREAARLLAANGKPAEALELYERLLSTKELGSSVRRELLGEGLPLLAQKGDSERFRRWQAELEKLRRPEP